MGLTGFEPLTTPRCLSFEIKSNKKHRCVIIKMFYYMFFNTWCDVADLNRLK